MFAAPLFFASNLVFGRGISHDVAPFILAFVRWTATSLLLLPFVFREKHACLAFVRAKPGLWLLLGFFGMWICGAGVYWALAYTTASNATLIYTTSSLFILLIERIIRKRPIGMRELLGMAIAFTGVSIIVLRGDWQALVSFRFNPGDIAILIAAISWAFYSVLQKNPALGGLSTLAVFGLLSIAGSLLLFPFALGEVILDHALPDSSSDWLKIAGIVVFSSVLAFSCFQHGIKVLGAPVAGVFLYLMPPFSILFASLFLGETLEPFHVTGIVLVMAGVILATIQPSVLRWRQGKTGS
jgi:drug/metabolite transporter (DMT)-like permease